MSSEVTYRPKMKTCGKPNCRKCREEGGHGPYWYAYATVEGRSQETYVGLRLPPGVPVPDVPTQRPRGAHTRLFALGHVRLERLREEVWFPVRDVAWLEQQDVRQLLGYLACSPGRTLPTEEARAVLWPDTQEDAASARLQQAVLVLQGIIEPPLRGHRRTMRPAPLLQDDREMLVLAGQSHLWIDADDFEMLLGEAYRTSDSGRREQLLEKAKALYGGDFWPEARLASWSASRREVLRRAWIGLHLELSDLYGARGNTNGAIEALDRLLAVDPANEAAAVRLMVILAGQSRRGEALRIYQRFVTVLEQETGVAPARETQLLYKAVRQGESITAAKTPLSSQKAAAKSLHPHFPAGTGEPVHSGRANQSPLVGRDAERTTLRTRLQEVDAPSGPGPAGAPGLEPRARFLLLKGESGLGKTRLAEEGGREALGRGWNVLWGRSYAQEGSIPFRIWEEILRDAFRQSQRASQEIAAHSPVIQALGALLPELHEYLSEPYRAATPEQEQLRLWDAARSLLSTIAGGMPLYIVLDDLQWADGSSCELLGYLVRQLRASPILIVGTCRESDLPSNKALSSLLASLQHEQAVELLSVQPLTDAQIRTLVAHVPEPLVQHIQAHAAGNPFFAEELARGIGPQPGTLPNGLPTLPDTIAAALDQRLSKLSLACQQLLGKASILGGSFQFSVLNQLVAAPSSPTSTTSPDDLVIDLLEEAIRSGVLTEEGTGTRIAYHFWHPLLVSHLYEGLSAARRTLLHLRAARILLQVYTGREEEEAAAITRHLTSGGAQSAEIARYAELAGDHAYRLSAYPDAVRYFRLAVDHQEEGSVYADRREQTRLSSLHERLGECLMILGEYEEARDWYSRALAVRCEQHADAELEAQVRSLLWSEVGWAWRYMGDMDRARQCCASGERVLRESGVAAGPAWATLRYQLSSLAWQEGNYEEAWSLAEAALALFEEALPGETLASAFPVTRIGRTLAGDPVDLGRIHTLLAAISATVGLSEAATSHYNTALLIFERHDRQREIASVTCNLGDLYLRRAKHHLAESSLRRSHSIAERIGDRATLCVVIGNLGVLARRIGNLSEAETWYRRATILAEQIADPIYISLWHAYLAAVLHDQGKFSEAGTAIRRAFASGRSIPPCLCFALVTLGSLRVSLAQITQLEQESAGYATPLVSARSADLPIRRALAMEGIEAETKTEGELALAQACLLCGDLEGALELVRTALGQAERNEQRALEARARELLGVVAMEQGRMKEAEHSFEQAGLVFDDAHMRLEGARVRVRWAMVLLSGRGVKPSRRKVGLSFLHEAGKVLDECHAALEGRRASALLKRYQK
jgi:DNA-binding SARP family transcriptional activator